MTDKILDIHNLQVQFQTNEQLISAVDGISFQLNRGQTLGIVGESGSGKSVTALAVMGLIPSPPGKIAGGEVYFRGLGADGGVLESIDLLKLGEKQRQRYRGNQISMIFQEPMSSLNPVYTCGFQLMEALQQHQTISKAEARRQAIALLQEVKLISSDEILRQRCLEEWHQHTAASPNAQPNERQLQQQINHQKLAFLDRYPHQLSGGQIQRVMIAIAISCNPAILIADEPTTALDVTVQAAILNLLQELRDRRGMSIIFVTHDLSTIAEIANFVAVMYRGKIVEYGSVEQIYTNPQHPYTKGLLTCRPQPDRRLKYLPTVSDFMELVTTPTGEQLREKPAPATQALVVTEAELAQRLARLQQRSPLLSVQNLQVFFPVRGVFGQTARYVAAVNGVSFEVFPGETLGLVGESGCGKTTLGRALLRLVEPTGGQILFDNQEVTTLRQPQLRRLRRQMQMIFQDPYGSLDPRMSIGDAVMEPMRVHGTESNEQQRRARAAYLLERVDLNPGLMRRYPHEFSGGQRQRICIARALALSPKLIICDESVSALDVSIQAQVLNLLKELQGEFDLTYIFISHDLSVVKFMSDRIIVMNHGKIEEIGPAEQIYRSPQKPYTRQLIASIPTGNLPATRRNSVQMPRQS